ncbi:unnamed protein product [Symbiodinium sp. KB8]|nr:unnamed protein product [Symbiodinium sp. KB8]
MLATKSNSRVMIGCIGKDSCHDHGHGEVRSVAVLRQTDLLNWPETIAVPVEQCGAAISWKATFSKAWVRTSDVCFCTAGAVILLVLNHAVDFLHFAQRIIVEATLGMMEKLMESSTSANKVEDALGWLITRQPCFEMPLPEQSSGRLMPVARRKKRSTGRLMPVARRKKRSNGRLKLYEEALRAQNPLSAIRPIDPDADTEVAARQDLEKAFLTRRV